MKYTAVIWDFNGTIADDIDLGIGAVNKMLAERGLPILSTREEYRAKLRFPIKDYYADLGFDFSKEPYEKLAHEWIALYNAGEKDVREMCIRDRNTRARRAHCRKARGSYPDRI